ncbi:MAG: N-acetylglucosaminyldiphosphoundecaprenol N-acetyl-beta-D-mannosaminyltransferase [Hyphomicrobiaceae bacterium]|jgi:N-acetylglucosaminyldiphosphoundecaprenol N-acetyl-beta-D-mannosaminyltransferase
MIWPALQRVAALALLLLLLPLFALLFLLVKATSRGPFLFHQERAGLQGKLFRIHKIRTMHATGGPARSLGITQSHPSITRVGKALRELKLDELPQLWNVICGDMAIVGPRPLPIVLEAELVRKIPGFLIRHRVRPGLTSIGQLMVDDNGVAEQLVEDWRARSQAERHYVRNRNCFYDLLVMALSVLYLARKALHFSISTKTSAGASSSVLGIPIANQNYESIVSQVATWRGQIQHRYICVCPVHSVVTARIDPKLRAALVGSDLNTADGMPIVWAQKLLGHKRASRVYGPDLTLKILERANAEGWRVGFYGAKPAVLEKLTGRLLTRYPQLQIVAAISPPFRQLTPAEDEQMTARIRDARPDVLFVGLGCPRQEKWMAAHAHIATTMIGVGAAFDFHAGAVRQCPPRLQRLGMEWLFRLAVEPRRLFWRYARTNPEYLIRITWQLLRRLFGRDYQIRNRKAQAKEAA